MNLVDVVAQTLQIDPSVLRADSRPANTENWDSLRHIEVIMAVEMAFGTHFTMAEMTSFRHLGDIAALLREKGCEPGEVPYAQAA